jgi:hypothetical protein
VSDNPDTVRLDYLERDGVHTRRLTDSWLVVDDLGASYRRTLRESVDAQLERAARKGAKS